MTAEQVALNLGYAFLAVYVIGAVVLLVWKWRA